MENDEFEIEKPQDSIGAAALEIKKAQKEEEKSLGYEPSDELYEAVRYVRYLGGKENILKIEYSEPRIKAVLSDAALIDEISLKKLGAKGVLKNRKDDAADIIIGYEMQTLFENIKKVLGKN